MRRGLVVLSLLSVFAAGCADDTGVSTRSRDSSEISDGLDGSDATDATDETDATDDTAVDSGETTSSVEETTSSSASTTVPVTTAAATTAPPTAPPTAATTVAPTDPPATTEPEPTGAPLDGDDTEWIGPEEGDPEVSAPGDECGPFFDAISDGPFTVSECGVWNALGGDRVWSVTRGASGQFFAVIWQSVGRDWVPSLRLREPAAGAWDDLNIETANIDSGPNEELVVGIHLAGSGGYLTVEILDIRSGDPAVVARVPELHHGRGLIEPEGVYVYTSQDNGDPECCPTAFDQFLIASTSSGWVLAEGAAGIETGAVPVSDI